MINIVEISPPRKVSGISSFIVTTNYNAPVIEALKTVQPYYYHPKVYEWEYPVSALSRLLDALTFFDDIRLQLLPDKTEDSKTDRFQLTETEIDSFKVKPFQHQLEAVNFGLDPKHKKWLLLDSPGTGKSMSIIAYAEILKQRGLIDHCMIICGVDSLRQNWKSEILKCSAESVMVLGEKISKKGKVSYLPIAKRAEILASPIEEFFVIVNATTLRHKSIIEAFNKSKNKFDFIAVDECHRFASSGATQSENLLKLNSEYKVAATGSLILNSPVSARVSLHWTDVDKATLTMFKSQYFVYGGFGNKSVVGYKNLDLLQEEIQANSLRRTLKQVRKNMPDKFIEYELLEMSEEHQKFYEAIKNGVKEEADKIELKTSNLLALTTRLRQATSCPGVLTSQSIDSTKVLRAVEIVEDLVEQGEKVVVLSVFKEPVYRLAELLAKYKPTVNTGDQNDDIVTKNKEAFLNDPDALIFLGTGDRVGTGYSLQSAAYLIMLDTPWTDANFQQWSDRVYRIVSERQVYIKVLCCLDTIDERVREIIEHKKELSDYLIDSVSNNVAISTALETELRNIIQQL